MFSGETPHGHVLHEDLVAFMGSKRGEGLMEVYEVMTDICSEKNHAKRILTFA